MNNYNIQPANPEHLEILVQFNKAMAMETESLKLEESVLRNGILKGLNNPEAAAYFVALKGDEVVGSLMITKEWSDWRCGWVAWIQSVYVKPQWRRKGVYSSLYQYIQNWVTTSDEFAGIRLYVDKTNQNAITTYSALGMNGNHYQLFEWMKNL